MKGILFTLLIVFLGSVCYADVEFLIFARPSNVKAGGYDYGDIVMVKEAGWKWGKEELNTDKFYILKVTDMTLEEANKYMEAKIGLDLKIEQKRLYQISVDTLDKDTAGEITKEGIYTLDKKQLEGYLIQK
jgi:hypothetical protein